MSACLMAQEAEMRVGMLWLDDDNRKGITDRVERAAAYYRGKYGQTPTLCIVHPATLGEEVFQGVGRMELRTSKSVLPDHLWLGIRESESVEPAPGMD